MTRSSLMTIVIDCKAGPHAYKVLKPLDSLKDCPLLAFLPCAREREEKPWELEAAVGGRDGKYCED